MGKRREDEMQVCSRLADGRGLSWLRSRAWEFRFTTSHPDLLIWLLLDTRSSRVVYSSVFCLGTVRYHEIYPRRIISSST